MPLALHQLLSGTAGPHGPADTSQRAARGVAVGERLPRRDDASRVGSDDRHVGERQQRMRTDPDIEHGDRRSIDDHEDRLAGIDAALDEPGRLFEQVVGARVHERLVPESGRAPTIDIDPCCLRQAALAIRDLISPGSGLVRARRTVSGLILPWMGPFKREATLPAC